MNRRLTCSLLILLGTLMPLSSAAAQDDLIETKWTVGDGGELLVHPHPASSPEENMEGVARPLFRIGGGEQSLGDILFSGGITSWLRFFLPGPVDFASHCDIEFHFRKLGLGLTDDDLVRRILTDPDTVASTELLRRRARLDRLLAVRLAARRKLAAAHPALWAILRDTTEDPFLRHAAWEALAEAGGPTVPPRERCLPPLLPILAEIPDSVDLVAVVNQARCPRWEGIASLAREFGLAQAREEVERLGAAVTPRDLLAGQLAIEHAGEQFYELARWLGNLRVHRTVVAVDLDGPVAVRVRLDGRFDAVRIRQALEEEGLGSEVEGDLVVCRIPEADGAIEFTPYRVEASFGEWTGEPGGLLLATELGIAGATGVEAVWVHLRNPAPPDVVRPFRGLASGTLAITFDEGILLAFRGEYVHAASARAAGGVLREMLADAPKELGLFPDSVDSFGPTLTVVLLARGESAEDVFRRLMRVR